MPKTTDSIVDIIKCKHVKLTKGNGAEKKHKCEALVVCLVSLKQREVGTNTLVVRGDDGVIIVGNGIYVKADWFLRFYSAWLPMPDQRTIRFGKCTRFILVRPVAYVLLGPVHVLRVFALFHPT